MAEHSTVHKKHTDKGPGGTLGTFAGVFTPSILTILGIILFMRLGYVVGGAGLGRALVMIGLANAISVLTSVSLSAIATNLKVKGGGVYYLISRTLGVEFGGAIGIVLFIAQSISIAFYCLGFGEALSGFLQENGGHMPQVIAALAVGFLFIFAWMGADWATRLQYVVMAILVAGLLSFFIGGLARWDHTILVQNWAVPPSGPGFWVLFAIFFPAVTGFTQGVSMSGDLKEPGKSLLLGTFAAVGLSILVYFGATVVLAGVLPNSALAEDYQAMKRVALFGILINAGVVAATLSSAMASLLGAPRVLQSLAGDRIFPFLLPFAKGHGPMNNPRRGVLLSAVIALGTIGLGKLNIIAPVVSMFFLVSYGLLNYATYFEARAASPSFRPTFRLFDKRLSLLGFLACLGAMLAIDIKSGIVAIAVLFAVYQYLRRTAGPSRWADSRRSYHLQRVRENLLAAASEPEHPRDWRPQILAFSDHPERRLALLQFASWIEGGSGFTSVVRILEGEGFKMLQLQKDAEQELRSNISEHGLTAFPLVLAAPDFHRALQDLVQSFGIGPIKANTVLLNWLGKVHDDILGISKATLTKNLRAVFRHGCNIVIMNVKDNTWHILEENAPPEKTIDVWWFWDSTSRLMLLLAYLMTRTEVWSGSKIRVIAPQANQDPGEKTIEHLQSILQEVRIEADPEILPGQGPEVILKYSANTSLVFLPFRFRGSALMGPFDEPLDGIIPELQAAAMVIAAEDIELDAEPEEGKAGELAAALDAFADTRERAEKAAKEATKTAEEAEKTVKELESTVDSGPGEELLEKIKAATEVRNQAEKAARKAARALAKAKEAAHAAEALGADIAREEPES